MVLGHQLGIGATGLTNTGRSYQLSASPGHFHGLGLMTTHGLMGDVAASSAQRVRRASATRPSP